MSELRVGVVGYGLRGTLVRYANRPADGVRVVAAADPSPAARDRFRADFGGVAVETLGELVDVGVDAVLVASIDRLHEEHAVALLEAGVAVYLEKPMAITTAGCDHILRVARERAGKLYVGHNMRHLPVVREMRRLIGSGAIGEPKVAWCRHFVGNGGDYYFADWHAERANGTSLLLQKGAHDIDVLHWLCGSYTAQVTAMGDLMVYGGNSRRPADLPTPRAAVDFDHWPPAAIPNLNPVIDVEDVSMMLMRLQSGVLASYQQCHFAPDYWRNYTVIGTEGRIENFGDTGPGTTVRVWNRRHEYAPDADLVVEVRAPEGSHGGADPSIVAEFLDYARGGGPTATSPVGARYAVAAGCAGAESLRAGSRPVDVPAADPADVAYFADRPGWRAAAA